MSTREACDKMRKKLLYFGYQMGYHIPNPQFPEDQDQKPAILCFKRVNAWVKEHGAVKKHINYMNYHELQKTVSQFEIVYKNFIAKTPVNNG